MRRYTVYAGDKVSEFNEELSDRSGNLIIECEPDDIDTAYDALAEGCILKDQDEDSKDLTDFQNCEDTDKNGNPSVTAMLDDLEKMNFISDYDVENME